MSYPNKHPRRQYGLYGRNLYRYIRRVLLLALPISFTIPLTYTELPITIFFFDIILVPLFVSVVVQKQFRFEKSALTFLCLVMVFTVWGLGTAIFSIDPLWSVDRVLLWIRILTCVFIAIEAYGRLYNTADIVKIATVLILLQGSIAIVQMITQTSIGQLNQYFGAKEITRHTVTFGELEILRAQGTFHNPNILAGWILILLPLTFLDSSDFSLKNKRLSQKSAIFVGTLTLLFTQSRGVTIFALLAAIGLLMALNRRYGLYVSILLLLGVSSLIVSPQLRKLPYISRFLDIFGGESARINSMVESFHVIAEYPLTGIGYWTYADGVSKLGLDIPGSAAAVHNIPLLVGAETGIVGLAIFIGIFLYPVKIFVSTYENTRNLMSLIYLYTTIVVIMNMMVYWYPIRFQMLPLIAVQLTTGILVCTTDSPHQ